MSLQGPRVKVSKEIQFDAGHRVPNHKSKCRNPHGHRYRVVVHCLGNIVTEPGASDQGMLIDFGDLKELMVMHIHDPLDHGFIVWHEDDRLIDMFTWDAKRTTPVGITDHGQVVGTFDWKVIVFPYIPTAENIAIWCWDQLEPLVNQHFRGNLQLSSVQVWETPTSMAQYFGT